MPESDYKHHKQEESIPWIPAIVIVITIIAVIWFMLYGDDEPKSTEPVTVTKSIPDDLIITEPENQIKFPVPVPEEKEALPEPVEEVIETAPDIPVDEEVVVLDIQEVSIPTIQERLSGLLGQAFEEWFIPESLVKNFVVTVDNMTAEKLPQRFGFSRPPTGKFLVIKEPDGSIFLDPANYGRYLPFVELLEKTDLNKLVKIYINYYHSFQEAYVSLGYPNRYFNDRLVEVIDHLLTAPEVTGKITLEQPKVFYRFTNPKLESLSAGQKILVRMGAENAARVKTRLRELRSLLTGQINR